MEEIWKDIKGYEGYYQCSSHGRVRSLSRKFVNSTGNKRELIGRILKPSEDKDGYHKCALSVGGITKSRRIHQLVYETFIGDRTMIINHIDGNNQNNIYTNLEQVNNRENMIHYYKVIKKGKHPTGVEPRNGKFRAKANIDGKTKHIGTFLTEHEAIQAYNKTVYSHDKTKKYT